MTRRPVFLPVNSRRAEDYVRRQLEHYGDTLARYGREIDWQQGRFSAIAPAGSDADYLNGLSPGLFNYSPAEVKDFLLQHFRSGNERGERGIWISELKQDLSRNDPDFNCQWFRYQPSRFTTWDGSQWRNWQEGACIWMRTLDTTVSEHLLRFFSEFLWGTQTAFLVREDARIPKNGVPVPAESLQDLIVAATQAVIPAHGCETYLVWSR